MAEEEEAEEEEEEGRRSGRDTEPKTRTHQDVGKKIKQQLPKCMANMNLGCFGP